MLGLARFWVQVIVSNGYSFEVVLVDITSERVANDGGHGEPVDLQLVMVVVVDHRLHVVTLSEVKVAHTRWLVCFIVSNFIL